MQFRTIVEKYFRHPIKYFQDYLGGGEYQEFTNFLRDNGIVQHSSCPYTPEQKGCAEIKKHRHIVELAEHYYIMPMSHINSGKMHLIPVCIL